MIIHSHQACLAKEGNRLTVFPSSKKGFAVSLASNSSSYTVSFDAWHDEYQDMEKALNSFAFGLSDDGRLEATYRGNLVFLWTVEEKGEDGGWSACEWIGLNEVGLLMPPLLGLQKRHVCLQNTLLKSRQEDESK